MSGAGRPLLAAPASSGEALRDDSGNGDGNGGGGGGGGSIKNPGGRPKRTLIESACSACRKRKSRCDGLRPACSRCQNLRTDCYYEAEEGESRWSALRRRNQVLEAEKDQLRDLLGFVQSQPESEAQEIFHRIRQTHYDDVFDLLRQIRQGSLILPPTSFKPHIPVTSSSDQRLPPIQTILDVHGIAPSLSHSHSLSSEDSRS